MLKIFSLPIKNQCIKSNFKHLIIGGHLWQSTQSDKNKFFNKKNIAIKTAGKNFTAQSNKDTLNIKNYTIQQHSDVTHKQ